MKKNIKITYKNKTKTLENSVIANLSQLKDIAIKTFNIETNLINIFYFDYSFGCLRDVPLNSDEQLAEINKHSEIYAKSPEFLVEEEFNLSEHIFSETEKIPIRDSLEKMNKMENNFDANLESSTDLTFNIVKAAKENLSESHLRILNTQLEETLKSKALENKGKEGARAYESDHHTETIHVCYLCRNDIHGCKYTCVICIDKKVFCSRCESVHNHPLLKFGCDKNCEKEIFKALAHQFKNDDEIMQEVLGLNRSTSTPIPTQRPEKARQIDQNNPNEGVQEKKLSAPIEFDVEQGELKKRKEDNVLSASLSPDFDYNNHNIPNDELRINANQKLYFRLLITNRGKLKIPKNTLIQAKESFSLNFEAQMLGKDLNEKGTMMIELPIASKGYNINKPNNSFTIELYLANQDYEIKQETLRLNVVIEETEEELNSFFREYKDMTSLPKEKKVQIRMLKNLNIVSINDLKIIKNVLEHKKWDTEESIVELFKKY